MASVALQRLTKKYGPLTVVDDVNLTIDDGQIACLLGPSGCGKTTTLRLIAGFISPDGGEIHVGDKRVSSPTKTLPPERRNMSMIFQSYALWPHLTIGENVAYGLKLRRLGKLDVKKRVDAILAVTHLETFIDRYPNELSGGQQQRVALARALVVEPETLLLDEPLSNLDANLREEMRFEIRRLHEKYKYTTIYVTHDQAEAMTTADRIVVMSQGKVEQVGAPEEIYQRPNSEFVARFIGGTNILKGRNTGSDAVECGGFTLRCGQGTLSPSGETAVSVRMHEIRLGLAEPNDRGANAVAGTVVRQIFLGAHRDYLVALPGDREVRVTAPMDVEAPVGSRVWLTFPPEQCRALAR